MESEVGDTRGLALSLASFAGLAARQQQWERAATLLGAWEGACVELKRTLPVPVPAEHQRAVEGARAALGAAALDGTQAGVSNIAVLADCAGASGGFAGVFDDWGNLNGIHITGDPSNFGIPRVKYANGWSGNTPFSPRHPGFGANIVFADDHARFVPGTRMQGCYGTGAHADTPGFVEWPVVNPLNVPPP